MRSLRDIPDSIILDQYNKFTYSLHNETKNVHIDQLNKTDSKDLIKVTLTRLLLNSLFLGSAYWV